MIYNWAINAWKKLILPPLFAAKTRLNDLLLAMLEGVQQAYNAFMLYREATLYKLRFTSQTIWLERLLNDRLNSGNPAFTDFETRLVPVGIYISDPASFKEGLFRWNKAENRHQAARYNRAELDLMPPNDVRRKYRFCNSELEANNDFVVKVPIALFDVTNPINAATVANMKAWIELYRIAGVRYTIVNY